MSATPLLVRVYGDSLGLPRPGDGLFPEQTYGELVRAGLQERRSGSHVSLFNRSRGGCTTQDLFRLHAQDVAYFGRDMEGLTILQCGVVDCAPRPVPPSVRDRVAVLPSLLRWPVAKVLHFMRPLLLRAGFSWRSSSRDQFEQSMQRWLQALGREQSRTFVINITPALPGVERHSPGLSASIRDYNAVLARCVAGSRARLIDAHGAIERAPEGLAAYLTTEDGYHLTAAAHALIARMILEHYDAGTA